MKMKVLVTVLVAGLFSVTAAQGCEEHGMSAKPVKAEIGSAFHAKTGTTVEFEEFEILVQKQTKATADKNGKKPAARNFRVMDKDKKKIAQVKLAETANAAANFEYAGKAYKITEAENKDAEEAHSFIVEEVKAEANTNKAE